MYIHPCNPSLLHAATSPHVHTRACACPHVCAHTRECIGGRRRAQRPAPHRTPAERVPLAQARRPGRKGGAYPEHVRHTRGVPRADVRVERRRTLEAERLRAEPPAVHADRTRSHVSARMRARPIPHAHTRARTDAARARVCAAGPHRRSVCPCS